MSVIMTTTTRLTWIRTLPILILGLAFLFGGGIAIGQGSDARATIRAGLTREQVTVSKDAPNVALRNKPVNSAESAEAQADAIWMHTMKATGGKTYAQLAKDDPARATAKDGAFLRSGLMLAVASFGVARLVIGLGWAALMLGLFVLMVGVPATYRVASRV